MLLNRLKYILPGLVGALLVGACAMVPPVQEMSDARQALKAAREAQAEQYAGQKLRSAEDSMELATRTLNQGEYEAARMAATVAKALAIKARDEALMARKE
ncbi:MAG: DUF4398 domain-containing protein [Gammaproteobacteria bacterium]|nr:DUF4398 domain-containing protein [Gammaproteobacteria bacterium]